MKGIEWAVVVLALVAALSVVLYALFEEPPALFGAWVAGFAFLIFILNEFMKTRQGPGEKVNF